MKKLLLFPTLLLALNLGAATEQNSEPQNDTQKTEIAKVEKKAPSFLVRHANKLKNFAYVTDIALPITLISLMNPNFIAKHLNYTQDNQKNDLKNSLFRIFFGTFILTTCTNLTAKYAMSKKYTFDIEALKNELAEQQAKTDAA